MRYLMSAVLLLAPLACTGPPLHDAPEGDYDLAAVELVHLPEEVVVGGGVVFVTEVANRGADAIPPSTYRVDLHLDDERISFDYATSGLPPGASTVYSMAEGYHHFMPSEPGTYTYRWMLDKEDNLPETDETNNVIEGTIVVAEPAAEHDRLREAEEAVLDQLALVGRKVVEGRFPPELDPGPDSTHKELEWFTDLFDDVEVMVYPGDEYSNYLTSRKPASPKELATHRLAFGSTGATEWPELFVQYFDGEEWAREATSGFTRDNRVTMTFRMAHDKHAGTFSVLDRRMSYLFPDEMGWLGVSTHGAAGRGLIVNSVEEGSPAQEAGLEEGDTLLTLADKPIISPSQLDFLVSRMKPGTEIAFGLVRGGVRMEMAIRLGARPAQRPPGHA